MSSPAESKCWSDYSDYLAAVDFPNGARVLVIDEIAEEEFYDRELRGMKPKPVLYFSGEDKGLIVEKTNRLMLIELFGDNQMNAVGKSVSLVPVRMTVAGKAWFPIRISRAVVANETKAAPPAPAADLAKSLAILKEARAEWKTLGGTPNPLSERKVKSFSLEEIEAEIRVAEDAVKSLRAQEVTK